MAEEGTIVVGVGLTGESGYVLEKVVRLAGDPGRIKAVHVLEQPHVLFQDDMTTIGEDVLQTIETGACARLERLCQRFGVRNFEVCLGHPPTELHRIAAQEDARLIAIGTHGRKGWRALLGETANAVLHGTSTDVLAVYAPDQLPEIVPEYRKILAAVDMTPEARAVVAAANRVCNRFDAQLAVLSVVRPLALVDAGVDFANAVDCRGIDEETQTQYESGLRELIVECGVPDAIALVRHGSPSVEINAAAEEVGADLIVVGTHGTSGPALLLGSTPNAVLHGVKQDVLAVRVGL